MHPCTCYQHACHALSNYMCDKLHGVNLVHAKHAIIGVALVFSIYRLSKFEEHNDYGHQWLRTDVELV